MVDSVAFDLGVGDFRVDEKTLNGSGIRRVEIHAPLAGPNQYGDYSPLDQVVRQAAFQEQPVCPHDSLGWLDSAKVRKAVLAAYDSVHAPQGHEVIILGYKDTLRTLFPEQIAAGKCLTITMSLPTPRGLWDPDLILIIHGHDYGKGDDLNCLNVPIPPPGGWVKADNDARNGRSLPDDSVYWERAKARSDSGLRSLVEIVVDKDKIWVNSVDSIPDSKYGKNFSKPRVPANCKWA